MSEVQHLCVANAEQVQRTLDRLAAEIAVALPDDFVFLGIRRRGVPLAGLLAERVQQHTGRHAAVAEVTVKRYADDLTLLHRDPALNGDQQPTSDCSLVIVDDVLYTGRSLLRVLNWLQVSHPPRICAAVLCARNARELPIQADFVGMQFDIGREGVIDVHIPPYEEDTSVWLSIRREQGTRNAQ